MDDCNDVGCYFRNIILFLRNSSIRFRIPLSQGGESGSNPEWRTIDRQYAVCYVSEMTHTEERTQMEWKYSIAIGKWYLPIAKNELWLTIERVPMIKSLGNYYYQATVFGIALDGRYATLEAAQTAAVKTALQWSRRVSTELTTAQLMFVGDNHEKASARPICVGID